MPNKYTCGICGKEFDNVIDRMNHERNCYQNKKDKEEKEKNEKLKEEENNRIQEISNAREHYFDLVSKFNEDYGNKGLFGDLWIDFLNYIN